MGPTQLEISLSLVLPSLLWTVVPSRRWQNQAREPQGHPKRPHAEAGRPTVHLGDRRQPHPNQSRSRHSSVAGDAPGRISGDVPIVLRRDGFCPSTAPPLGQRAEPTLSCSGWNSRSVELVPTPQRRECADWNFGSARPELRRPPADIPVMWAKAAGLRARLLTPH
jgi:hypothetical protein